MRSRFIFNLKSKHAFYRKRMNSKNLFIVSAVVKYAEAVKTHDFVAWNSVQDLAQTGRRERGEG